MTREIKYSELIAKMTLEQKAALLSGHTVFQTREFKHLGIPQLWLSDGPNGLRKQAGESDHLGLNPSESATCFPTASSVASSWDPEVARLQGQAMGEEAAAQGVGVILGPGLNIKRNPLCGRNFEYFSEDPLLAGKMAAGVVRGIQGQGIAACPKHFAVNNQEMRRMANDSIVDERTAREIYLAGFETVVKEAKPRSIMTSYNLINGTYANENKWLLKDILRDDWGFDGAVVTDWGGSNDHVAGVREGSTLEMPAPGGDSMREVINAVKAGTLAEADLNERVDEALELILTADETIQKAPKSFDIDAHHELAHEIAAQCAVLLKNDDNLLPLAEGTKVAVIGDFANNPRFQGSGSSKVNVTKSDSLLQKLGESGLDVLGYEQGFERFGEKNDALKSAAVELAQKADVVLMCMGTTELDESEGVDRPHMTVNNNQIELLSAVSAANANVVVLLSVGAPVESAWRKDCKSLVLLGLGGQAGAGAALDVVTGKVTPSGKLAETWAEHYEDVPGYADYPGKGRTTEYREGLYVGYRYYQTANVPVAFPFGYGLSYTSFEYSDILLGEVDANGIPHEISFTLTNTGGVDGAEVTQLYVAKPEHEVFRPAQELKGFVKTFLKAGESKRVAILLDERAFSYYNTKTANWEIEAGTYELRVASTSADVRLTTTVELAGTGAPNPYENLVLKAYNTGDVTNVDTQTFEALLGHKVPEGKPAIDRNMTFGELNHGRSPIGWIVWAVLNHLLKAAEARGEVDLNVTFIYNMPLRALAKMTSGMVSMGMVDGMVMEFKGFWIIGLLRVIVEFIINLIRNAALESKLAAAEKGE